MVKRECLNYCARVSSVLLDYAIKLNWIRLELGIVFKDPEITVRH